MSEARVAVCKCGQLTGYRSGLCARCRMIAENNARRKYRWTAALDADLRDVYRQPKRTALTAGISRLARITGWPRQAIYGRAHALGIAFSSGRRPWTPDELETLQEKAGSMSVARLVRKLHRSAYSIQEKAKKLRFSLRVRDGYTLDDLAVVFGVTPARAGRWVERGLFGRAQRANGVRVSEVSVIRFLRRYPQEYELRRVNEAWFKGMMFGYLAGVSNGE